MTQPYGCKKKGQKTAHYKAQWYALQTLLALCSHRDATASKDPFNSMNVKQRRCESRENQSHDFSKSCDQISPSSVVCSVMQN